MQLLALDNFVILNEIEKSLKSVECKSYVLEIKFDDDSRVIIEKKPNELQKKVGF